MESPVPAGRPVLASLLLRQTLESRKAGEQSASGPRKLKTGLQALDNDLDGVVALGSGITGMAVETGSSDSLASTLHLTILAAHLIPLDPASIPTQPAQAFYIDTTNGFQPMRLHRLLLDRLRTLSARSAVHSPEQAPPTDSALRTQAAHLMDKVSLLKVFTWTGLLEAIDEVRESVSAAAPPPDPAPRPLQIPDSQDDDLLSWPDSPPRQQQLVDQPARASPRGETVIVISSLPALLSPLMHASHVRAHAQLVALLRTLRLFSAALVLVGNNTVSTEARSANKAERRAGEASASAFADVALKPAMGRTFAALVDTSLLVSRRREWDRKAGERKRAWCAEVVAGERVGRWGVLWEGGDGMLG